jgi:DNA-binding response OmpR family regulator
LKADGNNVLLREQVFQVLRMLLEREGRIVTREEIKNRLWANDTVVDFDHSINATIKTPCAAAWGIPPITLGTSRPWLGVAID